MALVLNSKALDVALVIQASSGLPHLSLASVLVTLTFLEEIRVKYARYLKVV